MTNTQRIATTALPWEEWDTLLAEEDRWDSRAQLIRVAIRVGLETLPDLSEEDRQRLLDEDILRRAESRRADKAGRKVPALRPKKAG